MSHSDLLGRKTNISLADYPFHKEIDRRLLLASLSALEIEVFQEIINHSLTTSVAQLAEELDLPTDSLFPALDGLCAKQLCSMQNGIIATDKKVRKEFEEGLNKLHRRFKPNISFIQKELDRIPKHLLPTWYSFSKSSDTISHCITQTYFSTPKIYFDYLHELQFQNPVLRAIIKEVYESPGFTVSAKQLMKTYKLSHRSFEECILLLEHYFACFLSYRFVSGCWEEIVTPFTEILEYLQFEAETTPSPLLQDVTPFYTTEFHFLKEMKVACTESSHFSPAMEKIVQLGLVKRTVNKQPVLTDKGELWLAKSFPEQAAMLAGDPLNVPSTIQDFKSLWNTRNLHMIEKSLRKLTPLIWVEFSSFFKGFIAPIGDRKALSLKNKGTKWKYELPTYGEIEKRFVQTVIMERLAEMGVVATGSHLGNSCFCLTSFGGQFIR